MGGGGVDGMVIPLAALTARINRWGVGGSCYLSRIRFVNWVRQESELFNLFLSNKVSNIKK